MPILIVWGLVVKNLLQTLVIGLFFDIYHYIRTLKI